MKKILLLLAAITLLTACNLENVPTRVPEPTVFAPSANDSRTLYNIVPAESLTTFAVGETLKGSRVMATGATPYVSGGLLLDMDDLSTAVVGPINIESGSFITDNPTRDRAVSKWLLVSRGYPFITFTPTAVNNLPPTAAIGDTIEFEIVGDLLITTYSKPVTFAVTATAVSQDRIEGTAVGSIQREDYKLRVPSAPGVADVDQEVTLTFDFVATTE